MGTESIWNEWSSFCGSSGFFVWDEVSHNFGYCFQKFIFEFISFSLLAILSAYQVGKEAPWVVRTPRQISLIWLRMFVVVCLLTVTIVELSLYSSYSGKSLPQVEILGSVSQVIAWTVHLFYLHKLCTKISSGTRGKKNVNVAWLLSFLYSVCFTRMALSEQYRKDDPEAFIQFFQTTAALQLALQVLYLCTLFPKGIPVTSQYREISSGAGERTPLLDTTHNHYSRFQEILDPHYVGVGEEGVNWLSYLTFYWVNSIMEKGSRGQIESVDDVYHLPRELSCGHVSSVIQREVMLGKPLLDGEDRPMVKKKYYLFRAMYRCFARKFYLIGLLKLFGDLIGFAGPLMLHEMLTFVEGQESSLLRGYAAAVGLIMATIAGMLATTHYNYQLAKLNIQLRAALITAIFKKVQHVNVSGLLSVSEGEVVNFMSTDADRIVKFCESFHACWSMPLQLAITLFLLYSQIGIAFLAGIGITLVVLPLNRFIAVKIASYSKSMMHYKDTRVNIMTEVLRMMKAVKLSAWEGLFKRKIYAERAGEVKALSGIKYLDAACVYLWATTPVLIPIATFVTYAALGNTMDAAKIFTAVALFNMLIMPLNAFPWVLNGLVASWVSVCRVEKLMQLDERDLADYYTVVPEMAEPGNDMQIIVANGSFAWMASDNTENEARLPLRELSIRVKKGQFIGVVGKVGSGKTTFLNALIGEIEKVDGIVAVSSLHQGFGLATQVPWLQNCTIKENIIFGLKLDPYRYQYVIHSCCLEEDLDSFPLHDATRCGENGSALSSGQKARVALARAVYQNKSVYLFDDVLSAVDEPVARHIMQHCFHSFLADKTIILVTNHTHLLTRVDWVLVLEDGLLTVEGPPKVALKGIVSEDAFITEWRTGVHPQQATGTVPRQKADASGVAAVSYSSRIDEEYLQTVESEEVETRSFGELAFSVYVAYLSPIGAGLCTLIFFSMFLMQATRNLTDVWLAKWVSHSAHSLNSSLPLLKRNFSPENFIGIKPLLDSPGFLVTYDLPTMGPVWNGYSRLKDWASIGSFDPTTKFYLSVYGGLALTNSVFAMSRSFMFAVGGIVAAKKIHKKLLDSVLYAKMTFFDVNPLGRILNRFSTDIYVVDNALPFQMNIFFAQIFGLCGSIIITVYGVPWILLLYVPLIFLYYKIQFYYRHTSRDVRRIYALTLSPLYNHFTETINGLTIIRAMRCSHRFSVQTETYLEMNQKAQFCLNVVSQWLNLRLQVIGTAVLTGVTVLSLLQNYKDGISPGVIGLVISYALTINGYLNGVVTALTETERELISVERVDQYLQGTPKERRANTYDSSYPPLLALPYDWPDRGGILFENVYFKYHDHNPYSLRGIDLEIYPGEKIGIMGRTGAGKSSLLMALFRIGELARGRVVIDNVDITDISIRKLRTSMAIVSQDALLISGSIRENLDPRNESSETDVRKALEQCHLRDIVEEVGGINAPLPGGGQDLSAGQRQLFCLARALLSNAKIVCIDEGTALLDNKTDHQIQTVIRQALDHQIQTVIRQAFRDKTLIVIAHRIHTLRHCDRIIIMKNGEIHRICTPVEVMDKPCDSVFDE